MTIICAAKSDDGGVAIGSDTFARNGYYNEPVGPKWRNYGRWWIGLSGEWRLQNLIASAGDVIATRLKVWAVVDTIRDLVIADKWKPEPLDGGPEAYKLAALITDGREIWSVCGRFSVLPGGKFVAAGSGSEFAHGAAWMSMAGIRDNKLPKKAPTTLVHCAVLAAIALCNTCGGEPWVDFVYPTEP